MTQRAPEGHPLRTFITSLSPDDLNSSLSRARTAFNSIEPPVLKVTIPPQDTVEGLRRIITDHGIQYWHPDRMGRHFEEIEYQLSNELGLNEDESMATIRAQQEQSNPSRGLSRHAIEKLLTDSPQLLRDIFSKTKNEELQQALEGLFKAYQRWHVDKDATRGYFEKFGLEEFENSFRRASGVSDEDQQKIEEAERSEFERGHEWIELLKEGSPTTPDQFKTTFVAKNSASIARQREQIKSNHAQQLYLEQLARDAGYNITLDQTASTYVVSEIAA